MLMAKTEGELGQRRRQPAATSCAAPASIPISSCARPPPAKAWAVRKSRWTRCGSRASPIPNSTTPISAPPPVLDQLNGLSAALDHVPLAMPVSAGSFDKSSGFGARIDPFTGRYAFHPGIDFAGPWGSVVHATAPGTVVFAGNRGGYGNMVEIDHGYGIHTRYGHLSAISVRVGTRSGQGRGPWPGRLHRPQHRAACPLRSLVRRCRQEPEQLHRGRPPCSLAEAKNRSADQTPAPLAPAARRQAQPRAHSAPSIISADMVDHRHPRLRRRHADRRAGGRRCAQRRPGDRRQGRNPWRDLCRGRHRARQGGRPHPRPQGHSGATSHVEGDILHEAFAVEAGAFFEGNCRHSDNPLGDVDGASRRSQTASVSAAPGARRIPQFGDHMGRSRSPKLAAFVRFRRSTATARAAHALALLSRSSIFSRGLPPTSCASAAAMKGSRSPSSTSWGVRLSTPVRRSFTS